MDITMGFDYKNDYLGGRSQMILLYIFVLFLEVDVCNSWDYFVKSTFWGGLFFIFVDDPYIVFCCAYKSFFKGAKANFWLMYVYFTQFILNNLLIFEQNWIEVSP